MAEIKAPLSVTIEITGDCNLDCSCCFAFPIAKQHIPFKVVIKLIDKLIEWGVFRIELSGGEPFLHPEIIGIIKHLSEYENVIRWSLSTNGTLFTDDSIIKNLCKIMEAKELSHRIQISIDSHLEEVNDISRGLTSKVMEGINNLLKNGITPTIATVVHKKNIDLIDDMIAHFCTLGISCYHFMNFMPSIKAFQQENIEEMFVNHSKLINFWQQIESKAKYLPRVDIRTPLSEIAPAKKGSKLSECISCERCTAGWTHFTILPDLKVIPCGFARNVVMGNLNIMELEEIWNCEDAEEIRQYQENPCAISLQSLTTQKYLSKKWVKPLNIN